MKPPGLSLHPIRISFFSCGLPGHCACICISSTWLCWRYYYPSDWLLCWVPRGLHRLQGETHSPHMGLGIAESLNLANEMHVKVTCYSHAEAFNCQYLTPFLSSALLNSEHCPKTEATGRNQSGQDLSSWSQWAPKQTWRKQGFFTVLGQ